MQLQRQDREMSLQITPGENPEGKGLLGVELAPNGKSVYERPQNPIQIFTVAGERFQQLFVGTIKGFGQLITNFQQTASQVSGPVNIVKIGAKLAADNSANLLSFAAIISINLAVINILPLPALDGGQLFFLLIEGLFGKPLPMKIQEGVMQTGLVVLLGLGIFLIFKETLQLSFIQQIFQKM